MYLITLFAIIAFIFSVWRDRRSFLNPALLIICIILINISVAKILYDSGYVVAHGFIIFLLLFVIPLIILLSAVFLIYNGFILLKREGLSKTNLLSLILGIIILLFFALIFFYYTSVGRLFFSNMILTIIFIIIVFSYLLFGSAFVGLMLYSILYLAIPKNKLYDFIIIHGAGLKEGEYVTPLLKQRIDKAIEAFYKSKNPNIRIIASGGKGNDEKISEAQAIANYIEKETTVPTDRIILEDKSTTTYENLLFSKEIGESLIENPKFLFVTNNYHVYRTGAYAKKVGMVGDGLGCRTARYYIPSAFIREFIALCVKIKWVFAAFYAILISGLFLSYGYLLF